MADVVGALTVLGESADWLKDADGASIRDHRLAGLEAYRAAWARPSDGRLHKNLRGALASLFHALRHNHLYPDEIVLGKAKDGKPRFLPEFTSLRKDFEQLTNFCVVNRFGIGEIHLLYVTLLLCRMLYEMERVPYDQMIEQAVGDVLFLRVPIYRADNLGAFSSEVKARFHAVRILRCMRKLGLFNDDPVGTITPQDEALAKELLADKICAEAGRCVQEPHRAAFQVFDAASALEEHVRAHAASRVPLDERTPAELFNRLRHRIRRLAGRGKTGKVRRDRLMNLGVAAIVRAMAHVDHVLGQRMYSFLRTKSAGRPTVRHKRMFRLLPNNTERLRFLNFLHQHGSQNPIYYLRKFGPLFPKRRLRFVRKEVGFALEKPPASEPEAPPPEGSDSAESPGS